MSSNLGRQVKWQDDKGGWHTGRVVLLSDSVELLITRWVNNPPHRLENLVKEDHCGTLTWVETIQLEKWPDVKYCSVCCKEQDKCECGKAVTFSKPSNQLPNALECLVGKTIMICEEITKGIYFPVQGKTTYNTLKPPFYIKQSEWSDHIKTKELEQKKAEQRNYNYERMFASMPQPTPQSKVTREEVLQAASEESMLSQRSLLQQALEQIKEEEEALLALNSKLQEEYAEQVIQNQIERNYT